MTNLLEPQRLVDKKMPSIRPVSRFGTLASLTLACVAETWTTPGVSLSLTDLTGTLGAYTHEASLLPICGIADALAIAVALDQRLKR